ncbi:hypothetical protein OG800_03050 [Streptomyces sp. NBC_00445]|uniref:hypothetical protein n=1 Tax=unclassified Streptomyces TaxID=2593676 RepID=UPI002E22E901|nr:MULTISPECIES: hypothetical protein [unclassified Streptomyces]
MSENFHFGDKIDQTGDRNVGKVQGPVTYGDVDQSLQRITPGFEALAEAVADAVRHLSAAGVPDDVREDASDLATTIRAEVARDEPDPGTLRRAVATLKGYLAPIAITTATAGAAVGGEETAHVLIERLGNVL